MVSPEGIALRSLWVAAGAAGPRSEPAGWFSSAGRPSFERVDDGGATAASLAFKVLFRRGGVSSSVLFSTVKICTVLGASLTPFYVLSST